MTEHRHHKHLSTIVPRRARDYDPWGKNTRWADGRKAYPDCSMGCRFYYPLASRGREGLGADWGVCTNPKSHRCGLLTFEHQGCQKFEEQKKGQFP